MPASSHFDHIGSTSVTPADDTFGTMKTLCPTRWRSCGRLSATPIPTVFLYGRGRPSTSASPISPAAYKSGHQTRPSSGPHRSGKRRVSTSTSSRRLMALRNPTRRIREVRLNGELLDEAMVRHLMAQKALPHLASKVEALSCPRCRESHFDQDEKGFAAHAEHECEHCGHVFRPPGHHRLSVSNPLLSVFERLSRGRTA